MGVTLRTTLAVLALVGTTTAAPAQSSPGLSQTFAPYTQLLDAYVSERRLAEGGLVSAFDYTAALAAEDTEALLKRQDRRLANFEPENLETRERAVAFWINAYNYHMIAYLLRHPAEDGVPVDSVKDYGSFFSPYRVFQKSVFTIGGEDYSLDEMEKEILLGETYAERGWKDARVHFAVNCASVGCPPLRDTLYTADNVDAMLEENTRRALKTDRHFHRDGDTLHLSSLFDWYTQDYVEAAGSVERFLLKHGDEDVAQAVRETDDIAYIDYDWSLNRPANFPELDAGR